MLLLVIVLLPMIRWSVNVVIRVNERALAGTVSLLNCLGEIFHDMTTGEETRSRG